MVRLLGYREAGAFFPQWSPEDHIRAYAITGGVPHYLEQLNHLREVVRAVPGAGPQTRLALFGRVFDPRLRAAAAAEEVVLVSPAQLYAQPV